MQRLYKFLHLSKEDRRLLTNSFLIIGTIRIGLWLLPFRTIFRFIERVVKKYSQKNTVNHFNTDCVIRIVKTASRYIPKATCLTQALAARYLLARCGHTTNMQIGVLKDDKGDLEAHAWLESNGNILIGKLEDRTRYTTLPPFAGKSH